MSNIITMNNTLLEKILAWDLKTVVEFVVIENPDINQKDIRTSEQEYKYFIYLLAITGEPLSIPTKIVDLIWHAHILHTKNYIDFCNSLTGGYIHHTPYIYTEKKFRNNASKIKKLSQKVFANSVFDFDKKNLIKNVSHYSVGQRV